MTHERTAPVAALRYREGQLAEVTDVLPTEVPVMLEYNGVPYTVLLATPDDLVDLAVGFSLTEGIVAKASEVSVSLVEPLPEGWRVAMQIDGACFDRLMQRRQAPAGLTGEKGDSLLQANKKAGAVAGCDGTGRFTPAQLHGGFAQMEKAQVLRTQTGATHAAAWMDAAGQMALIREDVARHNALDKLIGALARKGVAFSAGAVLVTSRASHEMVRKCTAAGVRFLAAISAPTALAVRAAREAGLTLAAFVRQGGHTVYTCPERLCGEMKTAEAQENTDAGAETR